MVVKMVLVRGMFLMGENPPLGGNGTRECEAEPLMEKTGTCAPQMREMVLKRWNISDFLAKNGIEGGTCPLRMGEMVLRGWT
jgi:hypothetical protein